ncbi:MAG: T9SS type A sorting domain-containing protein [Flavobacteriales bacterium]|nr:T9SS type A sorting domain-containing protein [Flavobacteriales bacterium]
MFRGIPYAADFPGFIGHTLIAGAPIEMDRSFHRFALPAITTEINGDTYVYPNPASDHLMIDGLDGSVVEISVANALGSVFRRERIPSGTENWSLDLLGIAPGMYVILLRRQAMEPTDGGTLTEPTFGRFCPWSAILFHPPA